MSEVQSLRRQTVIMAAALMSIAELTGEEVTVDMANIHETASDALADMLQGNDAPLRAACDMLMRVSHADSSAAGWWNDPVTGADLADSPAFTFIVGTKLMLVVSEISEAMEGHRKGLKDDKLPHRPMIEVELADALLRIGDLAGKLGLDLGGAVAEKRAFNRVRPDHKREARQGFGGKQY